MYFSCSEIAVYGSPIKGKERMIVEKEMKGFDYKKSAAWSAIQSQFSSGIRHPELLSIAYLLERMVKLPTVSRTCKRSFVCLIKWFSDNWSEISKYIGRITLLDDHESAISGQRELREFCSA